MVNKLLLQLLLFNMVVRASNQLQFLTLHCHIHTTSCEDTSSLSLGICLKGFRLDLSKARERHVRPSLRKNYSILGSSLGHILSKNFIRSSETLSSCDGWFGLQREGDFLFCFEEFLTQKFQFGSLLFSGEFVDQGG